MKYCKYLTIMLLVSFVFASLNVNAWTLKAYSISFGNWGTQNKYTSYEDKTNYGSQSWETHHITNGGTLEVILQGDSLGDISDYIRIYLVENGTYTWKNDFSKDIDEN